MNEINQQFKQRIKLKNNRVYDISGMSMEDFVALRQGSIGGSDVSTILGLNEYKSSYELWGQKVGLYSPDTIDNAAMFFGRFLEDPIAELWQYWDKDQEQTIEHFKNKNPNPLKKIVTTRNLFIYHPTLEFLHATPDRLVKYDGMPGILELKTISGFNANKYIEGIPEYYKLQVMHYVWVTDLDFAEIALLIDGRTLKVFRFERDEKLIKDVIEPAVTKFWGKVLDAKEAIANGLDYAEHEPDIEDDNVEAYKKFLQEKYQTEQTTIEATSEEIKIATDLYLLKENGKLASLKAIALENKLKDYMKQAQVLDCGIYGKIHWSKNTNGQRVFRFNFDPLKS